MADDDAEIVPLFPPAGEGENPIRPSERTPFCQHHYVQLHAETRKVTCRECGREVDAFDVLVMLSRGIDRYEQVRDRAKREARAAEGRLEEIKRELRNAKARQRRSRAAAPAVEAVPDEEGIYPDCTVGCDVRGGAIHAPECPHYDPRV